MDLPDYPSATAALGGLLTGHVGQHRCTDGRYYTPMTWETCPVNQSGATLHEVLQSARTVAHRACHDEASVLAVAQAMVGHPDGQTVPLDSLDALQRSWWIDKARASMEAHAALLDPSVP